MDKLIKFFKDEEGAESVEYAMIVSLIVLAIIAVVTLLGGTLNNIFSEVVAAIE